MAGTWSGRPTPVPARVTGTALPAAPPRYQSLQVWDQALSLPPADVGLASVAQCANARSGSPCHCDAAGPRFTEPAARPCAGPHWPASCST